MRGSGDYVARVQGQAKGVEILSPEKTYRKKSSAIRTNSSGFSRWGA